MLRAAIGAPRTDQPGLDDIRNSLAPGRICTTSAPFEQVAGELLFFVEKWLRGSLSIVDISHTAFNVASHSHFS